MLGEELPQGFPGAEDALGEIGATGQAAVAAGAVGDELEADHAAVLGADLAPELGALLPGALTGDEEAGLVVPLVLELLEHVGGAHGVELAVLFVAHQQQVDGWVGGALLEGVLHPHQVGGDHGLHVGGATAPEVVALDAGLELAIVGLRRHHIEVAAEHGGSLLLAGEVGQHGGEGALIEGADGDAVVAQVVGDEGGGAVNLRQALHGAGRDAGDAHQALGYGQHLGGLVRVLRVHEGLGAGAEADGSLGVHVDLIPGVLHEVEDLALFRTQVGEVGRDGLDIGAHLVPTGFGQLHHEVRRHDVRGAQAGLQLLADALGGAGGAVDHGAQGLEVVPHAQGLGHGA